MDRLKDMREASSAYLDELLKNRVEKAKRCFTGEQRLWEYEFQKQIAGLVSMKKGRENNLVISSLCSSMVTGSNAYLIALYDDNIYLDTSPSCVLYCPEFLFRDLQEDVSGIEKYLHKKFIRLMADEMEEIRRIYMRRLYGEGKTFFAELIRGRNLHKMKVWFGEYMNYVDFIGYV